MNLSIYRLIKIVKKEFAISFRQRAIFASMLMFSLTTLACISLAIQGAKLEPELLSALLWVTIFFASSAINHTFDDEAIITLKVYGDSQSILFGKIIYSLISMIVMTTILLPTFVILFDCDVAEPLILIVTTFFVICGISGAGTLIAAISSAASVKNGLFPILLFPIILPIFLPAIKLTQISFIGLEISVPLLILMVIYNLILIVISSILFDYLWY